MLLFYLAMLFATKPNGCTRTPSTYSGRPENFTRWRYTALSMVCSVCVTLGSCNNPMPYMESLSHLQRKGKRIYRYYCQTFLWTCVLQKACFYLYNCGKIKWKW